MKEVIPHIAKPTVQRSSEPFFQRMAEEGRDNSAFFSSVQAKLSVGQKDDPFEKEADAVADKVVNRSSSEIQQATESTSVHKKVDSADHAASKPIQAKFESSETEERIDKKDDEGAEKEGDKKHVADEPDADIQRMCRECDEGDKIFRAEAGDPDISGMSKRDAVIAMAKTMLGKIKAKQPGGGGERYGAKELWEIFKLAAPGVWSEETVKTFGQQLPSWCGIFSVWAHKKAGIDLGNWQMGKGVTAFGTLKQTTSPQPGDIGYIDQPFQHHCIVTKVNGDTIESIDGNSGLYSEVIENTRPKTVFTGFFTAFSGIDGGVSKKDADQPLQKKSESNSNVAPPSVESSLSSSKGGGSGLSAETRAEMESGIGADFSNVRIHTDSSAVDMSKQLNAHAFTHGNDIYFNQGKFDIATNSGKHLLAHELTHTVQQGASKNDLSKKVQLTGAGAPAPLPDKGKIDADALAKISHITEGYMEKKDGEIQVHFNDFPVKQYTGPFVSVDKDGNEAIARPPFKKPKGERKTKQASVWRKDALPAVKGSLDKIVKDLGLEGKPLTLKPKSVKTAISGTAEELANEIIVPFWSYDGKGVKHEIEHKVDWQVAGGNNNVDHISNLLLLDSAANKNIGQVIDKKIKEFLLKIVGHYKKEGIKELPDEITAALAFYDVYFEDLKPAPEKVNGSLISITNLQPTSSNNPINTNVLEIRDMTIDKDHFVLKTSKSGAGNIVKKDLKNEHIEVEWDTATDKLKSITLIKVVKDEHGLMEENPEKIPLTDFKEESKGVYKVNTKGYAGLLKDTLRIKYLSPVEFTDMDFSPITGWNATGKVNTDIPLLQKIKDHVNISYDLENSNFTLAATITTDAFKNVFPKPFSLDYCNITIKASTAQDFSLVGEAGFGIEKLGSGRIKAGVTSKNKKGKGFVLGGDFIFDKSLFDGEIHFAYEDKAWTIGGGAKIDGKKIKGVKSGEVKFEYKDEKIFAGGKAFLTVPGISAIDINSEIGKDGDFSVSAEVTLEKIPRVKSGRVKVKIGKDKEGQWDLAVSGEVAPDLEFQGLKLGSVLVSFAKGAFDISISASYERSRIKAEEIKIGLTNKAISADGKTADGEPTKDMNFYGSLKLKVQVTDDIEGEIDSVLKPDGDITLDGKIELKEDKELFKVEPLDVPLLHIDKNIPLASCVVVTLSLHIGGAVNLYAAVQPLVVKKGSNVSIGNLSLKNFTDPHISSKIVLASNFKAGVKLALEVGLDASLIGILHAQVNGVGTLDFVAIEADALGVIDIGWSPGGGFKINEASVTLEMMSKLIASLDANVKIFADLWLTTIDIWSHTWPVAKEEFKLSFFDKKKFDIPIPIGGDNKLGAPKVEDNLSGVKNSATKEKIEDRAKNKIDGKGQTDEDKQAEVNTVTQKTVLDAFKNPDRFDFNKSDNYLVTRYGLYDYLKGKAGLDEKIDLSYIDSEIEKCEFEEYLAFSEYILNDTSFDDYSKSVIIEDFITNHPTLGPTELINLRNVVTVKVPEKEPLKTRASQVPKKTSDQPVSKPKTPVQAKSMKATGESQLASGSDSAADADVVSEIAGLGDFESQEHTDIADPGSYISYSDDTAESCSLEDMGVFEQNNENTFNTDFMRSYSRTRRPLQQRADEKRKGSFFNGPDKKEKAPGGAFFQAKLNVGSVDDPQEKEADQVADKVMAQPPKGNDKKEPADKTAPALPMSAMDEKKEKPEVQKKSHETEKEEENKTVVKKKQNGSSAGAKGRSVETSITEKKGKGNQLPGNILHDMEHAFGSDFSGVNIHTDSEAAALSNDLDAHAFTSGKDIYFNSGKFDPDSESGRHLLAHELTHVIQQNGDTVQREPKKDKDPEKTRAQGVRDSYQKALKGKSVDWREVAMYFNAFNQPEMQAKKAQLTAQQQFLLHQGAVHGPGVGPWSAAALNTTPITNMPDATAAGIEDKIIQSNYQQAINLMVDYLDGSGIIDRKLLWGGTFHYLAQDNLKGEGRVLAPGYDKDGKANPTASNIGTDAFGEDKGIPFLYSTIVHEYQHVQQMQKKDESKSAIPNQSGDDTTHLQQEVEAYGTELIQAKDTGLSNNPAQVEDTWFRLHMRWDQLDDIKKKDLKDIYVNAYKVAKEAVGMKTRLPYTPLK